jgi:hypothetical protein
VSKEQNLVLCLQVMPDVNFQHSDNRNKTEAEYRQTGKSFNGVGEVQEKGKELPFLISQILRSRR